MDGEVGHQNGARRLERATAAEPARELRGEVEHRDHHVRPLPLHDGEQPLLGEGGQRGAAGTWSVTGAEEGGVQARVQRGGMTDGVPVEAAQPGPGPVGQQVEHVDQERAVTGGFETVYQFRGHRVVAGAHARAEDEETSGHANPPGGVRRSPYVVSFSSCYDCFPMVCRVPGEVR
ncbi:hypothetical protein QFZ58_000614 [Streptomyces sp. B1I3]|nr:hypothetical protein [Streptomyces sp. B1I3]